MRPAMRRASSRASAAAKRSVQRLPTSPHAASGQVRRRNRPISPSTPPFSCAPLTPGAQKKKYSRNRTASPRTAELEAFPTQRDPDHRQLQIVIPDHPGRHPAEGFERSPSPSRNDSGFGWHSRRRTPSPNATAACKHVQLHHLPGDGSGELAESTSASAAGGWVCGTITWHRSAPISVRSRATRSAPSTHRSGHLPPPPAAAKSGGRYAAAS